MRSKLLGFARFSLLTGLQQAALAIGGILIVRALSVDDYARYAVTIGLIAAVAAIAEGGVAATVMSEGGKYQSDAAKFSALLRASERYRVLLLAIGLVVTAPLAWYLLQGVNMRGASAGIQALAVVVGSAAMSGSQLYASALRLRMRFDLVSSVLLTTALAKLGLVALVAHYGLELDALAAITAMTVALYGVEAVVFRRLLPHARSKAPRAREDFRTSFTRNARRQFPNSLFYVAQGQVLPIILVAAGNVSAIAQVAAISRYSLAFTVVSMILSQQFMPRMARGQTDQATRRSWRMAMSAYLAASAAVLAVIALARGPLLWLLGPEYSGLESELLVVSCGALLSGAVGMLASLNQARAWLRLAWIQIPLSVTWIALLLLFVRPVDVESAAWFSSLLLVPGVLSMLVCRQVGRRDDAARRAPGVGEISEVT